MNRSRRRRLHWITSLALLSVLFSLAGCVYILPLGGLAALLATKSSSKGGVLVLRDTSTSLFVARGDHDLGNTTEGKGVKIVATQLKLNSTHDTTLRSLTFTDTGTGSSDAIPAVELYLDPGSTGAIGSSTTALGLPAVFSKSAVTFAGLDLSLPGDKDVDILVVLTTPANARDSDTFQLGITDAAAIDAVTLSTSGQAQQVSIFGTPFLGGVKTISSSGSLNLFSGPNPPASATVFPNAQDVPVFQLELTTSSVEPVQVTGLTLQTSGSGNDAVDITGADVYEDTASNGKLDTGVDRPIVTGGVAKTDNGDLVFPTFAETIPAGTTVRWLVAYRLSGTAADKADFTLSLSSATDVTATGLASRLPITPAGAPVNGAAVITVDRAALQLTASSANSPRFASPGLPNVPALFVQATAGPAEAIVVTSFGVQASGSGNDASEITAARLYLDTNGNGSFDSGDTLLAGSLVYPSDNGKILFTGFSRTIAAGASETWIVVYDIAANASGNHQFIAAPVADASVTGELSGVVIASSASGQGGAITVTGSLSIGAGPVPPPASFPLADAVNVPALQVRISAGNGEGLNVRGIKVTPTGTADFTNDITSCDLYLDADSSGTLDAGDVLLQSAVFAGNKPLTFLDPTSLVTGGIPAGTHADFLVVFQLSGQAHLGDTFAVSVAPADVLITGQLSHATVVASGPLVQGSTITAERARLNFGPGAQNPGASTVLNGQANVPALQIAAVAAGAEDVNVNSLTFSSLGTADETFDVTSVDVYLEGTGPLGVVDATDTKLGSTQQFSADNGTVTFTGSPLYVHPKGTTQNLLVVYNLAGQGRATLNYQTTFTSATGVGASGFTSKLVSEIGGAATVTGGVQTIARGSIALAPGAKNPPLGNVFPNAKGLVVEQVKLTAGFPENVLVSSLKVTAIGTAEAIGAVTTVSLLDDTTGDGSATGKPVLGSGSLSGGTITFAPLTYLVPAGQTKNVLVVYDLSGTGLPGGTLRTQIASATDVVATGTTSNQPIVATGTPVSGNTQTIVLGSLAFSTVLGTNPGATKEFANASNLAMLQIKLQAGPIENVTLNTLKVTSLGSGNPTTALQSVQLYLDANANGQFDGADTFLAQTTFTGGVGGTATFSNGAAGLLSIAQSSTVSLIVVYQFQSTGVAAAGDTFTAEVATAGDASVTGNQSSAPITPTGLPVVGGQKTIQAATLTLAAGGQNPAAGFVFQNQTSFPVTQVTLTAGAAEAVRVTNVKVTANGTGDFLNGVSQVRLYRELPPVDGILDGDALIAAVTSFGTTGVINFAVPPGSLDVPAGGSQTLLVILDLAGPSLVSAGQTYGAQLTANTDVTALGLLSTLPLPAGSTGVSGIPPTIAGGLQTVQQATLTVAQGTHPPASGSVFKTQGGVVVSQFSLTAGAAEPVRVSSLRFTETGSLDGNTGLVQVRVFRDDANQGLFVNGEILCASATSFNDTSPGNGDVTLSVIPGTIDVPASGTVNLILVLDFGGTATNGQTITPALATTDVLSSGLTSTLPVTAGGSNVTGATKNVLDRTLTVTNTIPLPSPFVFNNVIGFRAEQLQLVANSSEGIRVTSITVHGDKGTPSETGTDTGINLRLYLDTNANGTLEAGEPLLGTGTYTADPGTVTFNVIGALDIPAATAVSVLILYDMPGTATDGQTFRATMSAADITGVGLTSLIPVVVQGGPFPLVGPTATIESTTLSISTAAQEPVSFPFPDSPSVGMLRFTVNAGVIEGVRITGLKLRPSALSTGDPSHAQVSLYVDVNGDGILEAGTDILVAGPQTGATTDTFTNPSGIVDIPAGSSLQMLAVYDFDGFAPANAAYDLSVAASDIVAQGIGSSSPVTATGATLTGGLKTITIGQLTLAQGAATPLLTANVLANAPGLAVLQASLAASSSEALEISQVKVTLTGTGAPAGVKAVHLYRDDNSNGVLDTDFFLADGTISGSVATFAIAPGKLDLAAGTTKNILVVLDLKGTATVGQTFGAQIAANSDVTAAGQSSLTPVVPMGAPVSSNLATVGVATLALSAAAQVPAADQFKNALGVSMVRFTATAGSAEGVRVTSVTLTPGGSGNVAFTNVKLYRDNNGNGTLDPVDTQLGTTQTGSNPVVFSAASLVDIPAGGTVQLLVVSDLVGAIAPGDTFELSLVAATDVVAQGLASTLNVTPTGPAPSGTPPAVFPGGLQTIVASQLTVALGSSTPLAGAVLANQANFELLQVKLAVDSTEAVRVSSLRFTATEKPPGNVGGHADTELSSVALYRDDDGNGVFAGDLQLGVGVFDSSGKVTFTITPGQLDLAAGSTQNLLLVVSGSGTAPMGDTFGAEILNDTDIVATGLTSTLTVVPLGAQPGSSPVAGNFKTVSTAGLTLAAPTFPVIQVAAANQLANAPSVPMVRFDAVAGAAEGVRITQITLRPTGASSGSATIAQVHLYLDTNGNGVVDAGEPQVGLQPGSGAIVFVGAPSLVDIPAGGTAHFIATYEFPSSPLPSEIGQTFDLELKSLGDVVAQGLSSTLPFTPAGTLPLAGGLQSIVAAQLTVTLGAKSPANTSVVPNEPNVVLVQATLTAGSAEGVSVSSVNFTLTGNVGHVALAQLYRDDNGNGVVDGDALLGTLNPPTGSALTFAGFAGALDLPANGVRNVILAIQLGSTLTDGESFQVSIAPATDVVASGATSLLAVTPGGTGFGGSLDTVGVPALTIAAPVIQVPSSSVFPNSPKVSMVAFTAKASALEAVRLTSVTVSAGTGDAVGAESVALYLDSNGNGVADPGEPLLDTKPGAASVTFAPVAGTADVPAGGTVQFLVVSTFTNASPVAGFNTYSFSESSAVAKGVTSSVGAVVTGGPVAGNVQTITQGTLTVALGGSTPPVGPARPGQSGLEALQATLMAGSAEALNVTQVVLTLHGPVADFTAVNLFRDDNNDGVLDGDFPLGAGSIAIVNPTTARATFTIAPGALQIAASTAKNLLAVIQVSTAAASGDALVVELQPADVTAAGLSSGVGVIATSATATGLAKTVAVPTLALTAPAPVLTGNQFPNASLVPLLRFVAKPGPAEAVALQTVTVTTTSATANESLALYIDSNNNGVVDPGEPMLGVATPGAASVTFTPVAGTANFNANTPVQLIVAASFTNATVGAGYQLTLGSVTAKGLLSTQPATVTGGGFTGGAQSIVAGGLTVNVGGSPPPTANVFPGDTDVAAIQVLLGAGPDEVVRVETLTFSVTETSADVSAVRLYRDDNADGVQDGDFLLGSTTVAGGFATFTITPGQLDLPANGSKNVLLVFDIAATAPATDTIVATIDPATQSTAQGLGSGLTLTGTGTLVTGNTKTVASSSLVLAAPQQAPTSRSFAGSSGIAALRFTAQAGAADSVDITQVTLTLASTPTAAAASDVSVRLYLDANDDGVLDPGDTLLGTQPGTNLVFTGAPLVSVPRGTTAAFLAVLDVGAGAVVPETWTLSLNATTDVVAKSLGSGQGITVGGTPPFAGGLDSVAVGGLTLSQGPNDPGNQVVAAGQTGVPVLQAQLLASASEPVAVSKVTIGLAGPVAGLSAARLYLDANGDGVVDSGDVLLDTIGAPALPLDFHPTSLVVPANGFANLLVVFDFAAGFTGDGQTFTASLASSGLTAQGTVSLVAPGIPAASVSGGIETFHIASLVLSAPAQVPAGKPFPATPAVPFLRFQAAAGVAEPVAISKIVLAGNSGAATFSLVLDTNSDGVFDTGDVVLAGPQPTGATVTFSGAPSLVTVPAGGVLSFLVIGDLSATTPGDTYALSLVQATDVTAAGTISLGNVIPVASGTPPFAGGLQTVQAGGTLTIAPGASSPATQTVYGNETGVSVLQATLQAGSPEGVRVTQLTATLTGTGAPGAVAQARLYRDDNGDGVLDSDLLLGTLAGPLSSAALTFTPPAGTLDIPAGGSRNVIVVLDWNKVAADGDQFGATIDASAGQIATGLVSGGMIPASGVATGALDTFGVASLTITDPAPAPAGNLLFGQSSVVLRFTATAGPAEPVRVSSFDFTATQFTLPDGMEQLRLFVDSNNDGVLDAGDTLVGSPATLSATGTTMTGTVIPAGASVNFLVVLDLLVAPTVGEQLALQLGLPSAIPATGVVSTLNVPATLTPQPIPGGLQTVVFPSISQAAGGANPGPNHVVLDGQTGVVLLQSALLAGAAEPVAVSQLSVNLTPMDAVQKVAVWLDANGNGVVDAGDVSLGSVVTNGTQSSVLVGLTGLTVPAGVTANLLVVCDLTATPVAGSTVQVQAGVSVATGVVSAQNATLTGAPVTSNPFSFISPLPSLAVSRVSNEGTGNVGASETRVVMLHLHLAEGTNNDSVVLQALNVTASGSGDDSSDVVNVQLWRDLSPTSSTVVAGDVLIGQARFFADNGVAAFAGLSETVPANGSLDLLVTYDFGSPLTAGKTYLATVNVGDVVAQSLSSAQPITPTNLPVSGPSRAVGAPSLTVAVGAQQPVDLAPGRLTRAGTNAVVMEQIAFTANAADVTLQGLTLEASGTGDDTRISSIALVLDKNGDGVWEAGEPELARINPIQTGTVGVTFNSKTVTGTGTNFPATFTVGQTIGFASQLGVTYTIASIANATTLQLTSPYGGTTTKPTTITTQAFASDNGTATFSGLTQLIRAGTTTNLLVVYDVGATSTAGATFMVSVQDPSAITATAPISTPLPTFPLMGRTLETVGGVTLAIGPNNPVGTTLTTFAGNEPVLEISLTADAAEDMAVNSLTITASGSADDTQAFTGAHLCHANGSPFDPATDLSFSDIGTPPFPASTPPNPPTATFFGLGQTIAAGTTVSWFVTLDVRDPTAPPAQTLGNRFRIAIAQNGDVAASGASGSTLTSGAALTSDPFSIQFTGTSFGAAHPLTLASGSTFGVTSVVAADFNGDGWLDYAVCVTDGTTSGVEVWSGTGGTTFTQSGLTLSSPFTGELRVADLNRDGLPDLVLFGTTGFTVFLNSPTGFSSGAAVTTSAGITDVVGFGITDYDRDGWPDIVLVGSSLSQEILGFRNDGTGSFGPSPDQILSVAPNTPVAATILDVNQDGIGDVAYIVQGGSPGVALALGDGTFFTPGLSLTLPSAGQQLLSGTFSSRGYPDLVMLDTPNDRFFELENQEPASPTYVLNGISPLGPTLSLTSGITGDWDGDGKLDLAFAQANPLQNGLVICSGNGLGNFPSIAQISPARPYDHLAAGDFERTGDPDLIAASATPGGFFDLVSSDGLTNGGLIDFAAPSSAPWNRSAVAVAAGDLNRDGWTDYVTVGVPGALAVWLNDTRGGFTKLPDVALAGTPVAVALADLDRDGKLEVIVTISGGAGSDRLQVFLGKGDGTFQAPDSVVPAVSSPGLGAIALGEISRDGTTWAAVVQTTDGSVQIFRNNGTGLADAQSSDRYPTTAASPVDVALVDVNHDGKLDLVTLCQGSGGVVEVRLGNGDGTFQSATPVSLGGAAGVPSRFAFADLDRDGQLDGVVASQDTPVVALLRGSPLGHFSVVGTSAATTATAVLVLDSNKDGLLDIVLARGDTQGSVAVLQGSGTFTFAGPVAQAAVDNVRLAGMVAADVDQDGDQDVIAVSADGRSVQVFRGR